MRYGVAELVMVQCNCSSLDEDMEICSGRLSAHLDLIKSELLEF